MIRFGQTNGTQGQFFAAYMENAKTRMTIDVKLDVFAQAVV